MIRWFGLLLTVALLAMGVEVGCSSNAGSRATTPEGRKFGALSSNVTAKGWTYASGTSGTYTVPSGYYATGIMSFCATGGSCTVAITPPLGDAAASPTVTLPAGGGLNLMPPIFATGFQDGLSDGTIITFSGTASYMVSLLQYGVQ